MSKRRRKDNAARLIKPLLALLAPAAGIGAAVAIAAAGSSTELGGTTDAPVTVFGRPVLQLSTTPGSSSYTTPDGVLTSWRYHSGPTAAGLRLVLFTHENTPHVYKAVASTDTKATAPNTGYEFNERIPVKQGYILGLSPSNDYIGIPAASGDVVDFFTFDVPVGDTSTATATGPALRVNVAATIEPDADNDGFGDKSQDRCPTQAATHDACSNKFSFGRLKHKRSRGTATLPVTVPGAGTLSVGGKGVVGKRLARALKAPAGRAVSAAGTVKLLIKAKGKAKRKLNSKGKVVVKAKVTYTPTDGAPNSKTPKVKLTKKGRA